MLRAVESDFPCTGEMGSLSINERPALVNARACGNSLLVSTKDR